MKKRAFISVWDKTGLVDFAKKLVENNYEIIATGTTCKFLKENKIEAIDSESITGFSELLGGKVKSLHPDIFAPILATESEQSELKDAPISLVAVNLYPFSDYIGKNTDIDTLVKNIDIGGVALLRAGAKNFKNVTVICDIKDYQIDINKIDEKLNETLALKAFSHTSKYDNIINQELSFNFGLVDKKKIQDEFALNFSKVQDLRYGENPHQEAGLFSCAGEIDYDILNGKELSYNNILDTTAALNIASEFFDVNCCVIVKHTNPCAVALGKTLQEAFLSALDSDPISPFGGIVAFSKEVDGTIAKHLASIFLEVVVAPSFTQDAIEILCSKKNLRVIKLNTPFEMYNSYNSKEVVMTPFGALVQQKNNKSIDAETFKVTTKKKPTQEQIEDMVFAFKVAKHCKSNAIVVAKDLKTLGICAAQTARVFSVEIALNRVCDSPKDAVIASDGFFPAVDNIDIIAQNRIAAIIQPAGSIKDDEVIAACDKYGITMVSTGIRHFKH